MFAVPCQECGRSYLVSVSSIEAFHTVAPGIIVVELTCLRGHPVRLVTGNAAPGHERDPHA